MPSMYTFSNPLYIGSLKGVMPYRILSDEERRRIVGMHEGRMKNLDVAFVLNVSRSTASTILPYWKV